MNGLLQPLIPYLLIHDTLLHFPLAFITYASVAVYYDLFELILGTSFILGKGSMLLMAWSCCANPGWEVLAWVSGHVVIVLVKIIRLCSTLLWSDQVGDMLSQVRSLEICDWSNRVRRFNSRVIHPIKYILMEFARLRFSPSLKHRAVGEVACCWPSIHGWSITSCLAHNSL